MTEKEKKRNFIMATEGNFGDIQKAE